MRQLPVMDAFAHSVRSTTTNLTFAFHASWPWLLVLLPVLIGGQLFVLRETGGNPELYTPAAHLANFVMAIVSMVSFASIAVNWHRYVLLDEMPQGAQRLRVDGTVWRYFGNVILIAIMMGLCIGLFALVVGFASMALGAVGGIVGVILLTVAVLYAIAASYRLGVKLPAIALERGGFGFGDAWRATEGNFWPMIGIGFLYFLLALAAAAIAFGLVFALTSALGLAGVVIAVAVQLVMQWLLTILGITMLTSLYGYFIENRNF